MKKKIIKAFMTAFPCALFLLMTGISLGKPVNADQPDQVGEYDLDRLETLLGELSKEEAQTKKETEKETESETSGEAAPGKTEYKDGTYYGTGTGFAGTIKVCVTVKDSKIISIELMEVQGDDAAFVERAKGVIDQIIKTQKLEVDAVSGATYSSRGIIEAVKNALTGEASKSTAAAPAAESSTAGQAQEPAAYKEPEYGYKDGTYTGSASGFGGTITVEITIKKGKMTAIKILEAGGEGASYLEKAKGILEKIIKNQNPKVDAASGATFTSNGIMNAVKNAMEKAKNTKTTTKEKNTKKKNKTKNQETENQDQTEKQPETENVSFEEPDGYKDGTYAAQSQGFRGTMTVTVVISGGKITDIQVAAKDDEPFITNAKTLISRIIAQQSVSGVDVVSGATYSSTGILNGVKGALKQAGVQIEETEKETEKETESEKETEPGTEPVPGKYLDGTYEGTSMGYAYDILATVTIVNGKISTITASSLEDPEEEEWLFMAEGSIIQAVLQSQNTEGVDTVSGATFTSRGLIAAIGQALQKAEHKGA